MGLVLVLGLSTNVYVLVNLKSVMSVPALVTSCLCQPKSRRVLGCSCLCVRVCLCLWDTCSASLLVEPANRKVLAVYLSLGRDSWSGVQWLGSNGPEQEQLEEVAVLRHHFTAQSISCAQDICWHRHPLFCSRGLVHVR